LVIIEEIQLELTTARSFPVMLALADMRPCWTVWSLDKEGCKLPELPLFVKAMFANGNGGEPGEDYQKHHTNPIELWIDDLSGSLKIKVALKLIQEAFEKEEGTRRKAMIGRRPLLPSTVDGRSIQRVWQHLQPVLHEPGDTERPRSDTTVRWSLPSHSLVLPRIEHDDACWLCAETEICVCKGQDIAAVVAGRARPSERSISDI
jgi:hypothetical protein